MGRSGVIVSISILAVVLVACKSPSESGDAGTGEPSLKELATSVSVPNEYSGKTGPDYFDQENLYKAIDGMAPEYISYGCVALAMLGWDVSGNSDEKLQVEIYDMGSPLGAYGIYSRAHVGEGDFADIGTEAAVAEDSVEFARGRYYVRILGPLDSQKSLQSIGHSIVDKVPAGPNAEDLLTLLPRKNLIARSDRWIPEAGFGMEFMRRIEVGRYKLGEDTVELHIAPFETEAAAREAFGKFREAMAKQSPKSLEGDREAFIYEDKWIGSVAVFLMDHYIVVAVGYRNSDAMDALLSSIPPSSKV